MDINPGSFNSADDDWDDNSNDPSIENSMDDPYAAPNQNSGTYDEYSYQYDSGYLNRDDESYESYGKFSEPASPYNSYDSYGEENYNDLGNVYSHQVNQNPYQTDPQLLDNQSEDGRDTNDADSHSNDSANTAIHIPLPAAAAGVVSTAALGIAKAMGKSNKESLGVAGTALGWMSTLAGLSLIPDKDFTIGSEPQSDNSDDSRS